jgi:hypothetical protein
MITDRRIYLLYGGQEDTIVIIDEAGSQEPYSQSQFNDVGNLGI